MELYLKTEFILLKIMLQRYQEFRKPSAFHFFFLKILLLIGGSKDSLKKLKASEATTAGVL